MTEIPFAIVLGLAAIIAAMARVRKPARGYIALAAALYAALAIGICVAAIAGAPALAAGIGFVVSALAPPLLALAMHASFSKPPHPAVAAPVLVICAIAGIAAAMNGAALLAFAPLFGAVCAMLVMGLRERSLYAGAGAAAFLAAAAGHMAAAQTAFMLFSAAGILGIAASLSLRVAGPCQRRPFALIRRAR